MDANEIKALTFDVFGTVVDWRASIAREAGELGRAVGVEADWDAFADAWRGLYQPSMAAVVEGRRPWAKLDVLHRESLETVLGTFAVRGLSDDEKEHLNRAWHRLDAWPDAVPGLTRLKRRYILATLSNGNVAMMVNMAKRAGLPWDAILGAEPARHYKADTECYLITADYLDLEPCRILMVAAHNPDLIRAAKLGFRTAFVPRPTEHGPGQATNLAPERDYDVVARDFTDLAGKLGC
jgi:2-haloacid dehalogenase